MPRIVKDESIRWRNTCEEPVDRACEIRARDFGVYYAGYFIELEGAIENMLHRHNIRDTASQIIYFFGVVADSRKQGALFIFRGLAIPFSSAVSSADFNFSRYSMFILFSFSGH